ncbi:MAG: DHA2 family efflux MFS transporter permease subunit, partial [Limosilactobacillus sp.]
VNIMVAVLFLGGFVLLLSETFMNNALPQVMKTFHISQATAQWVSTGYMMVAGLMIPISAWTFHRFKLRLTFAVLMLIFFAGSLIGWQAPNFGWLLAGRLIQAVAAGAIIPLTNNVLLVAYPQKIRGTMMGLSGIIVSFAPAIGPTLSGWIIDSYGWRMLFAILTPLSAIILVISLVTTKNITETRKVKLDNLSIILESLGLGSILYSLSSLGNTGQVTGIVIFTMLIGVALTTWFVVHSLKIANPMFDMRVFKNSRYNLMTALSSTSNIALVGIELIMPLYNQDVRGLTAFQSGLTLLVGAVLMGVLNPFTGHLYDKIGIRKLAISGNLVLTLGTLPMVFFNAHTPVAHIIAVYAIRSVGMAMTMLPLFSASMNTLSQKLAVDGNSAGSTIRQVAGSLGTAMMMMVVSLCSTGSTSAAALSNGYRAAFIAATLVAFLSFLLSFSLRNDE